MTPERLSEIVTLVENARNGPYVVDMGNELSVTDADGETLGGTIDRHTWQFIEQSEPVVLELLDEVDRLRARVAELEGESLRGVVIGPGLAVTGPPPGIIGSVTVGEPGL